MSSLSFKRPIRPFRLSLIIATIAVVGFMLLLVAWAILDGLQKPETWAARIKRCNEEWGLWLNVYSLAVGVVISLILYLNDKTNPFGEDERLREEQKQRMKILSHFSPTALEKTVALYSNRSIYDAILGTLERLDRRKGSASPGVKTKIDVCLLLCTPALDYRVPRPLKWGIEFISKVNNIAVCENVHLEVCHLPIEPTLGFNPMEDFLSVLAKFCSSGDGSDFNALHNELVDQTKLIAQMLTSLASQYQNRIKIHPPMFNIPFQIVLVRGDAQCEVIVSFAGREILERGDADPRGFFSSDPFVVETFHHIYTDYVKQGGRLAFIPRHTAAIIEKHKKQPAHEVINYLNLIPSLRVGDGCFSPAIANSSKFTCWALTKILNGRDESILDIGAGTGVLALVAQDTVKKLGVKARIVAVESDEKSFHTLQMNCPSGCGIDVKHWALASKSVDSTKRCGVFLDRSQGDREVTKNEVGQFKVIIADLPFVDARGDSARDQRFFDPSHQAHRNLFEAVANTQWLAAGGKLITAFSSLGGPDDVYAFERLINESGLQIIQRLDFHESNYLWIVHVIVRKEEFQSHDYWWDMLNARTIRAVTTDFQSVL